MTYKMEKLLKHAGFKEFICKDGVKGLIKNTIIFINDSQFRVILSDKEQSVLLPNNSLKKFTEYSDLYRLLTGNRMLSGISGNDLSIFMDEYFEDCFETE